MKFLKIKNETLAGDIDITFLKIANAIIAPAISEMLNCVYARAYILVLQKLPK